MDATRIDLPTLLDVTSAVWTATLELGLDPFPVDAPGPCVTGAVAVSGAWNGEVHLLAGIDVARRAATAMFGCREDEVGDAELADAVGELANQVGGGVKGLLPGPSTLSLPTVLLTGDDAAAPAGDVRLEASCAGHPVTVVVVPSPSAG